MMLCRATESPLSLNMLVVVALGSRLKLDFHFIDFFGCVTITHSEQILIFLECFHNFTREKTVKGIMYM